VEGGFTLVRRPEPAVTGGGAGPQGAGAAVLCEVAGAELEAERAHLGERRALEVAKLGELAAGGVDIAIGEQLDRARHERHREQSLRHRVVQLPREMRPLFPCRELAGLTTQVALETVAVADVPRGAVR